MLLGSNCGPDCDSRDGTSYVIEYLSIGFGASAILVFLAAIVVGEWKIRRKKKLEERLFAHSDRLMNSLSQ